MIHRHVDNRVSKVRATSRRPLKGKNGCEKAKESIVWVSVAVIVRFNVESIRAPIRVQKDDLNRCSCVLEVEKCHEVNRVVGAWYSYIQRIRAGCWYRYEVCNEFVDIGNVHRCMDVFEVKGLEFFAELPAGVD